MYSIIIVVSGGCQVEGRFQPNQHGPMVMYQIRLHHGLSQSFVRAIWLSVAVAASKQGCKSQVILDYLEQNVKWQDTKGNPLESVHGSCFSSHPKQRCVNLDHPKSGPPDQPWPTEPTEPPGQLQDTVHVEATGDLAALVHLGDDGNAISWQRQDGQKMNDRPREMGWTHMKTITYGKAYHHKMDQSWISWCKWPKSVRTWEILDVDTKPRPHIPRCWQLQPSQPSVQSAPTSLATTRIGPRNWRDNTRMGRWVWHFVHSQLVGCHNRKEFWE